MSSTNFVNTNKQNVLAQFFHFMKFFSSTMDRPQNMRPMHSGELEVQNKLGVAAEANDINEIGMQSKSFVCVVSNIIIFLH